MIGVSLVKDAILEQKTPFACIVIGIVALAIYGFTGHRISIG